MRIQDSFCRNQRGIFECKTEAQFFNILHQLCLPYDQNRSVLEDETTVEFELYGIEKNGFEKERALAAAKKAG